MMRRVIVLLVALCSASFALAAPAMDSSKRLSCKTEELRDCVAGAECLSGLPSEYGAPVLFSVDLVNRQVIGEERKSKIRDLEKKDGQLLLLGRELGYAWSIAIDAGNGDMTLSLVNREGAFVLFGRCVAK